MRTLIFRLLMLLLIVSGTTAHAVTRTVTIAGGTFDIEIENLPSQLLYAPVPNRPPLQPLDEIRLSVHYRAQQQTSRISMGRNRYAMEMDMANVVITAEPVRGFLRKENPMGFDDSYEGDEIIELGKNAAIRLTDPGNKFYCDGTGTETVRVKIEFGGYQVTNIQPSGGTFTTISGNHFIPFNQIESFDMTLDCVEPRNYSGAVIQTWQPQGEEINFGSEIELILIPPAPAKVGEAIKVIGLARYARQGVGSGGSNFTASGIRGINVAGHVHFQGRFPANDPLVSPVTEKRFAAATLNAVNDLRALDVDGFACVRPGRGILNWGFNAGAVIGFDNASPNSTFEVPDFGLMTMDVPFECQFNPVNQIRKTIVVHGAVLEVELNHQDRIIDDRQTHDITGTITYRSQAPSTELAAFNSRPAINFEGAPLALGGVRPLRSNFTCGQTIRQEHQVPLNFGFTRKTVWFPSNDSDSSDLSAPALSVPVPITCRNREFWGRVSGRSFGDHIPLMDMKVQMTLDGTPYFTRTDSDGYFDFVDANTILQYNDNSQFSLRFIFADGFGPQPQQFRLVDNMNADTAFVETAGSPIANFPRSYTIGDHLAAWVTPNPSIPQAYDLDHEKLKNYATAFALYSEATAFANRHMNVSFVSPPPVGPLTVSMYDAATMISNASIADNRIRLQIIDSLPHDHWAGISTMMHELGHMVMGHSRIGGLLTQPQPRNGIKEKNHMGRANFSTTDSWIEAFASWFAVVALKDYRTPLMRARDYRPGSYEQTDVSVNQVNDLYQVWDVEGRYEEWALAATLWDVYDAPSFYRNRRDGVDGNNDAVTVPLWRLWPVLHQAGVRDFKDVYDALSGLAPHYPNWRTSLDQIFVRHGIFADNDGDRIYDAGEEVGRSAWGATSFVTQLDVNGDKDYTDRWEGHFPLGSSAVMPASLSSSADLVPTLPNPVGYYTSADANNADIGLRNDDANSMDVELKERFIVHPQMIRRSTEIPADRHLHYTATDSSGAAVPETDLRVHYEYDPPGDWQNYSLAARIPGQGSIPLAVPPQGRLRIEMFAGAFVSNELIIDPQTASNNALRLGHQGDVQFQIPATATEIAQAMANTPAPVTPPAAAPGTPGTGGTAPPAPAPGLIPVALIALGILILILIVVLIISRRP